MTDAAFNRAIGGAVRRLINDRGYENPAEFANVNALPFVTVYRTINGRPPRIATLRRVAERLGTTASAILAEAEAQCA